MPKPPTTVKNAPLVLTTGRRKAAIARVWLRPGQRRDQGQRARRRRLLPRGDAPAAADRAAAGERDRRRLRRVRHHRRWRHHRPGRRAAPRHRPRPRRARRGAAALAQEGRASSPATPARRSRRSTASRRPGRLRSTPSADRCASSSPATRRTRRTSRDAAVRDRRCSRGGEPRPDAGAGRRARRAAARVLGVRSSSSSGATRASPGRCSRPRWPRASPPKASTSTRSASCRHRRWRGRRRTTGAAGAMISASHNRYPDNGIKLFTPAGRKLDDDVETALEADARRARARTRSDADASRRPATPIGTVEAAPEHCSPTPTRSCDVDRRTGPRRVCGVVVDCANGSATTIAPHVLRRLGAERRRAPRRPERHQHQRGLRLDPPRRPAARGGRARRRRRARVRRRRRPCPGGRRATASSSTATRSSPSARSICTSAAGFATTPSS